MNIAKAVEKRYETMTFKQLADAPVAALAGVSENDAKVLEQAFGIRTIGDLGKNALFRAAATIANAAELEC